MKSEDVKVGKWYWVKIITVYKMLCVGKTERGAVFVDNKQRDTGNFFEFNNILSEVVEPDVTPFWNRIFKRKGTK